MRSFLHIPLLLALCALPTPTHAAGDEAGFIATSAAFLAVASGCIWGIRSCLHRHRQAGLQAKLRQAITMLDTRGVQHLLGQGADPQLVDQHSLYSAWDQACLLHCQHMTQDIEQNIHRSQAVIRLLLPSVRNPQEEATQALAYQNFDLCQLIVEGVADYIGPITPRLDQTALLKEVMRNPSLSRLPNRNSMVSCLLKHDADVNTICSPTTTVQPLHIAAAENDMELVQLLVSHGANVASRTQELSGEGYRGANLTAEEIADQADHPWIASYLKRVKEQRVREHHALTQQPTPALRKNYSSSSLSTHTSSSPSSVSSTSTERSNGIFRW